MTFAVEKVGYKKHARENRHYFGATPHIDINLVVRIRRCKAFSTLRVSTIVAGSLRSFTHSNNMAPSKAFAETYSNREDRF